MQTAAILSSFFPKHKIVYDKMMLCLPSKQATPVWSTQLDAKAKKTFRFYSDIGIPSILAWCKFCSRFTLRQATSVAGFAVTHSIDRVEKKRSLHIRLQKV